MLGLAAFRTFDPYSGPRGQRVKRFLESNPPRWWGRIAPPIILMAICWWFGPFVVAIFIAIVIVNLLVITMPIYLVVFFLTGGR